MTASIGTHGEALTEHEERVSRNNNIYVCDCLNHRIEVLTAKLVPFNNLGIEPVEQS